VIIDITHIAKLARLHLEADETQKLEKEMYLIIDMVENMPVLAAEDCNLDPQVPMQLRPDRIIPSFSRKEILNNAPATLNSCMVVPKTVE